MKKKRGNTDLVSNDGPAKKLSKVTAEDEAEDGDEGKTEGNSVGPAAAASGSVVEDTGKAEGDENRKEKPQAWEDTRRIILAKHSREMMLLGQRWADPCRLEYLQKLGPVSLPAPTALGAPPPREVPVENPLLNNCVLKHLFGFLSDYPQLPNLRTVCKKWNEEIVLQTRKNPRYEVRLGDKVHGQNDVAKFIEEMEEGILFPFGHFYFGHYLAKSCTNVIFKMFEKYGVFMKSVQFVLHVGHYMTQGKFAAILKTLINLEELSIYGFPSAISATNNFIFELQENRPRLLKLKSFRLTHPGQDPYTKSLLESDYSTEFLTILFKNAPNLSSAALHWPTDSKASTITHFMDAVCHVYSGTDNLLNLKLKCAITENHVDTLLKHKLKLDSLSIGYLDHNVDRRTFEALLKKYRLGLRSLDVGDGSYETPELFVWARGEAVNLTFPCMEKLETLILKCDGTHEFRKLGFNQICYRTQFPALKSLMFVESPGTMDYLHKFLLPLPLPLSISQKSYTVTKLQISGSLRLIRKGFLTPRNYVKLLSKRFPALNALNMYHTTIDLLPHIWKYFKRIEDLHLVVTGSSERPICIDESLTGIDDGVCKWLSKTPAASVDPVFITSILATRKRSVCDLKELRDFTLDILDVGQTTHHRIAITDSSVYFALVHMHNLESLVLNSYHMTSSGVEYLKRNKVGKKFLNFEVKALGERYLPSDSDDETFSSDSENGVVTESGTGTNPQNDDFIMALAVNYTDYEQDDDPNNSGDDDADGDDQDQDLDDGDGDHWDNHSGSDMQSNESNHDGSVQDLDDDGLDHDDNDDVVDHDQDAFPWAGVNYADEPWRANQPPLNENSQSDGSSVQFSGSGSGRSPPFSDEEDRQVQDVVDQDQDSVRSNEEFVLGRYFRGMPNTSRYVLGSPLSTPINSPPVSRRSRSFSRSPSPVSQRSRSFSRSPSPVSRRSRSFSRSLSPVSPSLASSPGQFLDSRSRSFSRSPSPLSSRGEYSRGNFSIPSPPGSSNDESNHEFDYIRSPTPPRRNYSDDDSVYNRDNSSVDSVATRYIPSDGEASPISSRSRHSSLRSSISSTSTRLVSVNRSSFFGDEDSDLGGSMNLRLNYTRSPSASPQSVDDDDPQNETSSRSSVSVEESPYLWESNSEEEAVDDEERDVESDDRVEYGDDRSPEEGDEQEDEMQELDAIDDEERESEYRSDSRSERSSLESDEEYDH